MSKPSTLKTLTIKIDPKTLSVLEHIAEKLHRSRSEIIRMAIDIYIKTILTNEALRKYIFGDEGE